MRNGYFRTQGLEVQKIQIQSEIAVKALVAGEVDYVLAWGTSVQAAMTGAPIKVVAAMVSRPLHVLISRPEIRFGRDLKGENPGCRLLRQQGRLFVPRGREVFGARSGQGCQNRRHGRQLASGRGLEGRFH